jgi:hypothetical protein
MNEKHRAMGFGFAGTGAEVVRVAVAVPTEAEQLRLEIGALDMVARALEPLQHAQRKRVLEWAIARYVRDGEP